MRHALAGVVLAVTLAGVQLPASAQENEDAEAIAELKQAGIDLGKPQTIDFAFYFPQRKAAQRVAPKLAAQGFKTRIVPAGGGQDYLVYARKRIIVNEAVMLEWRSKFEALAASEQGEYDGWGSPSAQ
jgi:hypothetical protein